MHLRNVALTLWLLINSNILIGQTNVDSLIELISGINKVILNPNNHKDSDTALYRNLFLEYRTKEPVIARRIAYEMVYELSALEGIENSLLKDNSYLFYWYEQLSLLNYKLDKLSLAKESSYEGLMLLSEFDDLEKIERMARLCIKSNNDLNGDIGEMQDVYRKMGEAFVYQRDTAKQLAYEKEITDLGNKNILRDWSGIKSYYKNILENEDKAIIEEKIFTEFCAKPSALLQTGEYFYDRYLEENNISKERLVINNSAISYPWYFGERNWKIHKVFRIDSITYLLGVSIIQDSSESASYNESIRRGFVTVRYHSNSVQLSEMEYGVDFIYSDFYDSSAYDLLKVENIENTLEIIERTWRTFYKEDTYTMLKTLKALPDSLIDAMNSKFVSALKDHDSSWLYGSYYFNNNYHSLGWATAVFEDVLIVNGFNPFTSFPILYSHGRELSLGASEERQRAAFKPFDGIISFVFWFLMNLPKILIALAIGYFIYFRWYKKKKASSSKNVELSSEEFEGATNQKEGVSEYQKKTFRSISNVMLVLLYALLCALAGAWLGATLADNQMGTSAGNLLVPIYGIFLFFVGGVVGLVTGPIVLARIKKRRRRK
ncbi:MAG: hypothetical protein JXQ87_19085 [Bacteroidia bacterium]